MPPRERPDRIHVAFDAHRSLSSRGKRITESNILVLVRLVEIGGLEPPTSALRTPRSPS